MSGSALAQGTPRGVFLASSQLGCPANLALTTQLHNYVVANGWTFEPAESADCLVVVVCSILLEYRRSVTERVQYLLRRYADKQIVVTGCFVKEDMLEAPNLTYIPMAEKDAFDSTFRPFDPSARLRDVSSLSTAAEDSAVREIRDAKAVFDRPYTVSVQTGCLSRCAYCIERNLFPEIKSMPPADVVSSFRTGLEKGYRNFIVGGTDVCSYGADLGLDVTDLFDALFGEVFTGQPGVGVGLKAVEPSRFIRHFEVLKKYFETRRIDWIYLPIESGSDRVLRTMRRKYRVEEVLQAVAELRRITPSIRIETDFVVCFPTETAEEFEASLRLLDRFDYSNIVVFNRHRDTEAFSMKDEFGPEERARRRAVVEALCARRVETYRPECRTQIEVPLSLSGGSGLFVLEPRLARRPI